MLRDIHKKGKLMVCDYCFQVDYCINVSPIKHDEYYSIHLCPICRAMYNRENGKGSIQNFIDSRIRSNLDIDFKISGCLL